jgi:hypothetical protein
MKDLNYDVIKYDAGDVRNKSLIDTITRDNVSRYNVLDMMHGRIRKIAILMDEIDGMHKGDKGGISALVKLIRQKKTKKQKTENVTMNPVICIGNYYMDKKIKELMNVCNVFELPTPTDDQIRNIYEHLFAESVLSKNMALMDQMVQYTQGDIRKIEFLVRLNEKKPEILTGENIRHIFRAKFYNEDYGKIAKQLFDRKLTVKQHSDFMNDNDRTTVALLWHENVADRITTLPKKDAFPFYLKLIDNICFADYIDRITFQKQIWQFNEMSSLIKTFKNNKLYHTTFPKKVKYNPQEVRFTKVLTKYSTEYNNSLFIQNLCQQLSMDQKDIFSFFLDLKKTLTDGEILQLFENYEVNKLDINRIYRYLEKYTKENAIDEEVEEIDDVE